MSLEAARGYDGFYRSMHRADERVKWDPASLQVHDRVGAPLHKLFLIFGSLRFAYMNRNLDMFFFVSFMFLCVVLAKGEPGK